ncbi:3-hydroxyacyl-CoA dehydrogenase NAD-binding domain-containing protein [Haladaptatus sp. GCM10025707]|uniref:3-hydroxyacyl-CoA dehydrogenase/enoyl-CoA hydratase family protein n=1 Tax=unclassified Haladaptatus TaxID=2622732 RepID=UPI0023E7C109|nr:MULTISPECIES: 3-hydroxyacyl-CoA dehydrogenase/enoyl-CoA hydratase family protein [unclassified Haladaptatus]
MELDDINTIAVLGAGNMGHGIAEIAALAGYNVTLRDIKDEFVQNGYDNIEWSLQKLAEKDQISEEEADAALERITPLVDLAEAVSNADFIIEVVPEKMDIKKEVYAEVEEHAPDHAIFATNTSSLSITELSEVTDRPEHFCGMHFFNPPVRMALVEVITGAYTNEDTLKLTEELAESFGKTPVRVRKDSPGFIVNRVLVPLMNEACWIVEDGTATMEEVDSTVKFDIGLPMGAFELGDQVGNDVTYHVLEYMHEVLGDAYEPCPLLEETVENEHYGKKVGKGFYDYEDGDGANIPTDKGREDVKHRLLGIMANEVGNLVGNDVAPAKDVDEAVMLGAGFPKGPAKMADEVGLSVLVEALDDLHEETGAARYEVADALREHAEEGGFYAGEDESVEFSTIELEYPGDMIGHIILSREARMNTVNEEMLDDLSNAIDLLEADDEVRAILITGKGGRAFSAGADVSSMAGSADPLDAIDLSKKGQETFGKLESCSMPVLAAIDGFALGGGFELSMCADLRIASERSEIGLPEHSLGLLPGWGGTQRLQRLVGMSRAKEIIFTAERFDAETMYDYDVINEVVSNDDFEERAHELAAKLAGGPPISQKLTKRAMLRGWENVDAGLELEASAFGHLMGTDDLMEGVTAFMSKRDPEFEGK